MVDFPWIFCVGTKDTPPRPVRRLPAGQLEAFSLSPAEVFMICTQRERERGAWGGGFNSIVSFFAKRFSVQ